MALAKLMDTIKNSLPQYILKVLQLDASVWLPAARPRFNFLLVHRELPDAQHAMAKVIHFMRDITANEMEKTTLPTKKLFLPVGPALAKELALMGTAAPQPLSTCFEVACHQIDVIQK
jgi:hypothetical protein